MARSRAHAKLPKLSPILYDTLVQLELMPYRELATPEELKAALQGGSASSLRPPNERIIVRTMMRSNESITVGKKQPTLKNTVMALPDKFIIFLGRTFSGRNHDYLKLKQELPPELDWFADINVRVALGYLGIKSDYRGEQIAIPTRKPRKSQKHPNPQLSEEQKAANTALSRVRIFIEHAIGGMKRSNSLVHTFRNRIEHCEDDVIGICAGLWNLVLSY